MSGVAATVPNLTLEGFLAILYLIEAQQDTTTQIRLDRTVTLTLGERYPVLVCLD